MAVVARGRAAGHRRGPCRPAGAGWAVVPRRQQSAELSGGAAADASVVIAAADAASPGAAAAAATTTPRERDEHRCGGCGGSVDGRGSGGRHAAYALRADDSASAASTPQPMARHEDGEDRCHDEHDERYDDEADEDDGAGSRRRSSSAAAEKMMRQLYPHG